MRARASRPAACVGRSRRHGHVGRPDNAESCPPAKPSRRISLPVWEAAFTAPLGGYSGGVGGGRAKIWSSSPRVDFVIEPGILTSDGSASMDVKVLSERSAREQIKAYAQESSRYLLLAFGNPGFASDEYRSSTQPHHWSCHELPQEKRCKESPFPS